MKKYIIIIGLIVSQYLFSQDDTSIPLPVKAIVSGNDTLPLIDLPEVQVYAYWGKVYASKKLFEEWTRTKYNVKKVYPYAILASALLQEMDNKLAQIPSEKERKIFIKQCEKELRAKFEEDLKNLSVTQGKILMKLIYRETGKTTFQIVKEMRGGFEAAMWQALAFIFGNSMKVQYDPSGEDFMVEKAVQLVEKGYF
ncbi:MAG TPA: DUF4294 domain-containing protein [Bacteroidia bacterium]|nr:DUF4294 domain-containing protein [Bacteroidia bacterium]